MDNALVLHIIVTGIGATLLMDGWSMCQKKLLRVPPLNYGLVGRWPLWLPRGEGSEGGRVGEDGEGEGRGEGTISR